MNNIPTMKEISNIQHNGYNVISTFSGCGGSSLGYKMAGYKVLWANEFIPAAQDTYKANHPNTFLNISDIRNITGERIKNESQIDEIDIFDGSPPCASFSMSGKREKSWGVIKKYSDTKQRVDDLFFEYTRLIDELKPKICIAENVAGLTFGIAKTQVLGENQYNLFNKQEKTILYKIEECGYNVSYRILNAKDFGVAQNRPRIFIVGVRKDLDLSPSFPMPLNKNYLTFRDVTKDLIHTDKEIQESLTDPKYESYKYIIKMKPGETGDMYNEKGSWFSLKRLEYDKYVGTVLQSHGSPGMASAHIHPERNGKLTIKELKRVQGFPDDFELTGTFQQKWERIGRSVCPSVMYHLSKCLKEKVLDIC